MRLQIEYETFAHVGKELPNIGNDEPMARVSEVTRRIMFLAREKFKFNCHYAKKF